MKAPKISLGDAIITSTGNEGIVVAIDPGCVTIDIDGEFESHDPEDLVISNSSL
jgi:preprotein translocase subunit YajC